MYAYGKIAPVQVKLRSYRTIKQLFTSKAQFLRLTIEIQCLVPTLWIMKIILNQNKKLIAINNNKTSSRRGTKARLSTLYCVKCYPLVHIGDWIFQSTQRAMYMMENENNRNKIYIFWGRHWILHCVIRYCSLCWFCHQSTFRYPFSIFHKRLVVFQFFRMMCAYRNSLFYTKNSYSKNINRTEICLILSASNND